MHTRTSTKTVCNRNFKISEYFFVIETGNAKGSEAAD